MKVGYKKLGLVLGAVAAVALLPARADAQFVRYSPVYWSFEGGVGLAVPMGDLDDVASSGISIAAAGSYFLNPRFALRVEGGVDFMDAGDTAPSDVDLQIWHFLAGFEYHLSDPTSNLLFAIDFGAGGVTFDTDFFEITATETTEGFIGTFSQTYFAAQGGVKLGYSFARHASTGVPIATIYINGDIHWMFSDEADTARFAEFNGVPRFGSTYVIPITAGLRFNIP